MKSTKTTIGGVAALVAALAYMVIQFVNGEPMDTAKLLEALAMLGVGGGAAYTGLAARDDNVSSEGTVAAKAQKQ